MTDTPKPKPVLNLTCACCGAYTRGRQWHNRDNGFGLCPDCIDDVGINDADRQDAYGVRGIHYDVKE